MTNEVIAENYSSKRINYLKGIADDIWDHDPDSYVIFEHFQNSEERVFSDYGISPGEKKIISIMKLLWDILLTLMVFLIKGEDFLILHLLDLWRVTTKRD